MPNIEGEPKESELVIRLKKLVQIALGNASTDEKSGKFAMMQTNDYLAIQYGELLKKLQNGEMTEDEILKILDGEE